MDALLAALPLSLSSGINLYLTVFVVGLAIRLEWLTGLPQELQVLASLPVLIVAGVLVFLEFFADKIPYIDNVWNLIHTFIRPLGAFLLAFNLAPEGDSAALALSLGLLGGLSGLTAHSTKTGFRFLVNASPEPVSNTVVSTAEDVGVLGMVALFIWNPLIAVGVSVIVLVLLIVALYFIVRMLRGAFRSLGDFLSRYSRNRSNVDPALRG
ncbi:MAG: DUF4126 domain-containing protein [Phototrophicaceae bacterium]|jgi:hypothetical protein